MAANMAAAAPSYEVGPDTKEPIYDIEDKASNPVYPAEEHRNNGQTELKRSLKGRHMQMIAIGGSIGAGLFVGSGGALYKGGPASLIIDFIIIGIMLLFTVTALGELATMYPVNGSFYNYSVRFIDPAWGFAMGWNYSMNWLIVLPFELTAASITIEFWDPEQKINIAVWISIFLVSVIAINFFGVKGYGEVEFVLGVMKVLAIVGFIICGIVINVGGVPTDNRGYIGGQYWTSDGNGRSAFRNGFHGFCSVFVTASFAFGGTELVGLAAAEAADPRKSIPKATKQVFWRISIFYVVSLLVLGLIVQSNDPNLSKASGANTKYSPFVLAFQNAGIPVLPSIFNAVITLSVISVANSCSYASTRTLQALCLQGMGPRIGARIDKKGRPYVALILTLLLGFLAYVNLAPQGGDIFNWLLALSGLSNFFTWGSICLAHIRFRTAWSRAGRSLDDLPFRSQFGVWGSWIGLALNIMCLAAQFYIALYPIGGPDLDAYGFFSSYLAGPVVLIFYLGYKIVKNDWSLCVDLSTIDLDAGRREGWEDLGDIIRQEKLEASQAPAWKKAYRWIC